ncbi:MarR family transcriptional regulator [Brucella pseudintermedia]|uniref:MarR family transcriptional regulator n=1 Tax=Brucella pseudintermedia TaxID=370111 RepID=A0ABY5UEW0_9HYPH|nr:MarR family transcriptional regulator [Brucella pseudintermedia]UWL61879.1 MarR family transcriptional regulator [Brucella pseudintermedia]
MSKPDDKQEEWPGEGLVVSPETIDLDVLDDTFSYFIRDLNIAVSRDWEARLEGMDELRGTGKVTALLAINKYPGIHPSTIAQINLRDRAEVARTLNALEKDGLIYRRPGRKDSRSWSLFLTDKGKDIIEPLRQRIRESRQFLYDVSDEEYEQVMGLLRRIYWRLVMAPHPVGGKPWATNE